MKYFRSVSITLLALSMGLGGFALAKDRDPPARKDAPSKQVEKQRNEKKAAPGKQVNNQRGDKRGVPSKQVYNERGEARDKKGEWRGAGPNQNFRRGGKLTQQYRSRQYVVDDWRGHGLSAPPRGSHWVQTGADYVLATVATGVILQVLLNH